MRPQKPKMTGEGDLFRARLDQIVNMKHELVQLGGKIDWDGIDREIALFYSDKGRPGIETRFVIGHLLLKHIYGLSDEGACERWVYDPYFQHFTGEEFLHERSDLSHWRKRLGDKLELLVAESLRVAHETGALRPRDLVLEAAFEAPLARCTDPVAAAAPARTEALFFPRPRGRMHRQGQGLGSLRVRRQSLDRHYQCPGRRPVRAPRQGAAW
jgi:IS5 family transposase